VGEGERPSSSGGGGGGGGAVVVGIEHIPTLAALAEKNIRMDGLGKAMDEQGIVLVTGDGRLGSFFFFLSSSSPSVLESNRNSSSFVRVR